MLRLTLKASIVAWSVVTVLFICLYARSYWRSDGVRFVDDHGCGSMLIDSGRFVRVYQPMVTQTDEGFSTDGWFFGREPGAWIPVQYEGFGISRGHIFSSYANDMQFLTLPLWWAPAASGLLLFMSVLALKLLSLRRRGWWNRGFEVVRS